MKIEAITARELSMRLVAPFETSFGVTLDRRVVLLEVHTDVGIGWSELTAMERRWHLAEREPGDHSIHLTQISMGDSAVAAIYSEIEASRARREPSL